MVIFSAFAAIPRHGDVGLGGRGITAGLIVHQDQGRGALFQGALDDLAGIDRGMIDSALRLHLIGDQDILAVEIQHPEFLSWRAGHGRHAIIDQRRPG